ncbi:MAG: hypothetical protein FWE63_06285 [Bacteroidales bacterium]|nr:hypothetical protein [Bacteroidales bacterium]
MQKIQKPYQFTEEEPITANEPAVVYQTTVSEVSESTFRCTEEQRRTIVQAQQAVARGEKVYHKEVQKAVELCLSEN